MSFAAIYQPQEDLPNRRSHSLQSNVYNVQRHHKSEANQCLGNVHEEPFISSLSYTWRVSSVTASSLGQENIHSQPQKCHLTLSWLCSRVRSMSTLFLAPRHLTLSEFVQS